MGKIKKKVALIFGITGQDGSYLAEFLLKKNYIIHGVKRRSSSANTERIDHLFDSLNFSNKNFFIHYGDISDGTSTLSIINKIKPDEIYNLAAQSHVRVSFDVPEYTADITALGALRILESIKILNLKKTKYYQASSSEMYGLVDKKKSLNEKTPFHPRSVYGVSKVFAYHAAVHYREAYGLFASNGILFNHESPRRGPTFVTKKIVQGLVRIKKGLQKKLTLGNLYAVRDWGHAKDYAVSMWKILQYKKPDDWVIATNKENTVKNFVNLTAKKLTIKIKWIGKGIKEKAIDMNTKKTIIDLDPKFLRPTEVDFLRGDFSKARKKLKWKPLISTNELIDDMIQDEMNR
ncbi:GDP-mannose 4,6-dehydratase [Candidatus Pelagibacter bacterium]|jgi:GDPmannose 4,6-dehydratase|nr:GDP-mannose 4,6-dehydratase [Candidatus Pelagibacter bacterium]MDA8772907.1 GDP-mannose 4,6-dehydratase [Candidatus Pelagibacter bacterium]